ncbi:MAG: amino acid decarboxylase [Woeseia sp.]|nr:amino acid decarboxylase [Woeseia sp.]MBT8096982.1 amino acid decarboxylase [Woeseia sp.]NNE62235.1 amino acid decarboxylase [Woeseia sp.]NNL55925.1 amino acid decarboxylase [Woeseia sp.]
MNADQDPKPGTIAEQTLDPQNWARFRKLGHRALDDLIDYLQTVDERPVWQSLPPAAKNLFAEPLAKKGLGDDAVYEQVKQHVLPYPTGNIHPRFWSWVGGTGTPTQLIADMVMSTMNSCGLGFDESAASHVELQLLDWLKALLDYPLDASGLLVSGGSMANLVGLAVARTAQAPYDARDTGVDSHQHARLIYYTSSEAHSCIRKGIELLGLGSQSLRTIPVLDDYSMDVSALRRAIASDRAAGRQPACIVATSGTVNTGASDSLCELADIAEQEKLWLHVDGAFGACVRLSSRFRELAAGLERADSVAFDLHKWLYVQYNCGAVLVRGDSPHKATFSVLPAYLRKLDRGLASGPVNFSEYGVQLSRSFHALRAWMALRSAGSQRYAEQIEQNIDQARYLSNLVDDHKELERLAPTAMNIVNFRYRAEGLDESQLNDLNAELLMRLHEDGVAAPSATELNGCFSIRVANTNHRSRRADFDALVAGAVRIGRELASRC